MIALSALDYGIVLFLLLVALVALRALYLEVEAICLDLKRYREERRAAAYRGGHRASA